MADDDAATEQKKAEAEARRKRIMEKSKARMDKVSGLQQEADAEDEETKTSSSARMQAMRRRRFKKGAKAKEETSGETANAEAKTEGKTEPESSAPTAEPETKGAKEETKKVSSMATDKTQIKDEQKSTTEKKEPPKEESTKTGEDAAASQKKYKGVAKMRREKMLQKKKEEAAKAAEEEAKNPTSQSPAVQARRKKRMKQPVLPILLYLLTTILLFLAGLDVGLQHADDSILVNHEFAPNQFNVQKLNPWGGKSGPIKDLDSDTDLYSGRGLGEQDEFGTVDDSVDADYIPNIDPLFGVDLDELTKGPGVVNQLGRGAVKIHRLILYVMWELPLQFFALPQLLLQYPPVMCLAALSIRQILGKLVFGAKLPSAIEEDVRNTKEMTDILTMIKNAVKNTVVGTFPTAVSIYEGFTFLKTDMYVMLCGVFVGLLYSTWTLGNAEGLPPVDADDVMPDLHVEEVVTDGMADEL